MVQLVKGEFLLYQSFIPGGKCTMPLTNIDSDWMSNATSGLCIILGYIILFILYYTGPLSCILGCNILRGSFKLHLGGN